MVKTRRPHQVVAAVRWAHVVGAPRVRPHEHWPDHPPQSDRGKSGGGELSGAFCTGRECGTAPVHLRTSLECSGNLTACHGWWAQRLARPSAERGCRLAAGKSPPGPSDASTSARPQSRADWFSLAASADRRTGRAGSSARSRRLSGRSRRGGGGVQAWQVPAPVPRSSQC